MTVEEMVMTRLIWLACALALTGCDKSDGGGLESPTWDGATTHSLQLSASDNVEVVAWIPGTDQVLVGSSKSRRLRRLTIDGDRLVESDSVVVAPEAVGDSEMTHVAVAPSGAWAAATQTIVTSDAAGKQTGCGGAVWLVDLGADYGATLASVTVGPMPDNVAVSPNEAWVAVANERDGPDAWGKCTVATEPGSVSLIDVAAGPKTAAEVHRIPFLDTKTAPREPEALAFAADSDRLVVTLQDSHEVALISIAAIAAGGEPTIVSLPLGPLGDGAWPDGVVRLAGTADTFAVAGEWNDTLTVLTGAGDVLASLLLDRATVPVGLPYAVDEGTPPLSPDSLTTFQHAGRTFVATTLRHAGAVMVLDVTDPAEPVVARVVGVGAHEAGGRDADGSTVRPEGVAAAPDGRALVVANEGEATVSLVRPTAPR